MKKISFLFVVLGLILNLVAVSNAEQIKLFVTGIDVNGVQNKDELKTALQPILMSRLNGERILVTDSQPGAEITVTGSYVAFGKFFSIDAVAKNASGSVITRAFVQGESTDELIPAMGKLAQQLSEGILKGYKSPPSSAAAPLPPGIQYPAKEPSITAAKEVVNVQGVGKIASDRWSSQRIADTLIGIAKGNTYPNGDRDLFTVSDRVLRLYRQEEELRLIAEVAIPADENIIGVDTADLDGNGTSEAYVTVWNGNTLMSQIWAMGDKKLEKIAEGLPYFFRGIALKGGEKKIYVQQINSDNDFYGDIYELVKNENRYEIKNPVKLPRAGNLFNFNMFTDPKGKSHYIVMSDGNLTVYDSDHVKLWRSSKNYGGSETNFERIDYTYAKLTGESKRRVYLDQRITVTKQGEIIVPQNTGFLTHSYSNSSVFCFTWNGSSLIEKWHTNQSENYLSDYFYDESDHSLTLLEIVDKAGVADNGATAVSVIKTR